MALEKNTKNYYNKPGRGKNLLYDNQKLASIKQKKMRKLKIKGWKISVRTTHTHVSHLVFRPIVLVGPLEVL